MVDVWLKPSGLQSAEPGLLRSVVPRPSHLWKPIDPRHRRLWIHRPACRRGFEAALRFYRDSVTDASARHCAWAAAHYRSVTARFHDAFWTDSAAGAGPGASDARAGDAGPAPALDDDLPLELSAECRWEELPCLGDRYVEVKRALRHPRLDGRSRTSAVTNWPRSCEIFAPPCEADWNTGRPGLIDQLCQVCAGSSHAGGQGR